jgi:hypothetical protein
MSSLRDRTRVNILWANTKRPISFPSRNLRIMRKSVVEQPESRLWQPNSLFLSTRQHLSLWNVAMDPQDYLFFSNAVPTLPQSYGIGCRRVRGPNYSIIS